MRRVIAGWWFANPARRGEELIAAGLRDARRAYRPGRVGLVDACRLGAPSWVNVGVRFRRKRTLLSHGKARAFQPRNGYLMTLMPLTSSNGTVVFPPIWVS